MQQRIQGGSVQYEVQDGIGSISFFHPQSNSLPSALLQQLAAVIAQAGNDAGAKVLVLRSGGDKVFCSGASFDELAAIQTEEEGIRFFSGFADAINALRQAPKLVIGRIHGKCVGGGTGLAAAVDVAIATAAAEIKLSELTIGIGPFVVGPAIERKIGVSAFSQLSVAASRWFDAEWAFQKGLYAEVQHTVPEMDDSINLLAQQLSACSPDAMAELKKVLWHGTDDWGLLLQHRAAISGRLVLSRYTREALAKFKKA